MNNEVFTLTSFIMFFIGFCIGFIVCKLKDIDIELENEKLRKGIIELELKLNELKNERDFLKNQIELLQDECDAYRESFASGINTRNF